MTQEARQWDCHRASGGLSNAHGARQTEKSYHGVGGSVEENRIFTLTNPDATNHALGADTRDTGAVTGETGTRGDQARDS